MTSKSRIPFYRNPVYRNVISQVVVLAIVVWALLTIFDNTVTNLNERGIQTGFGFLNETAPFSGQLFTIHRIRTRRKHLLGGVFHRHAKHDLVSIAGILAATTIGFIIGIARLSPNFLLSSFASTYIEIFRNTPLLLQIMFWNFAVFLPLFPGPRESLTLGEQVFLNNRGVYLPAPELGDNLASPVSRSAIAVILGLVAMYAFNRWAKIKQYYTGIRPPGRLYGLAVLVGAVVAVYLLLPPPLVFEVPELGTFNLSGGIEVPLPLFALWFALTTYTAAFIAENVRGGIQSVTKGQIEAASSLGLPRPKMMRFVIIPQAMRVIIPPTISQYLNLTKNSSLAVAVAYEELVNVWAGIALNQTGQALIIIAMTIAVYEALSLTPRPPELVQPKRADGGEIADGQHRHIRGQGKPAAARAQDNRMELDARTAVRLGHEHDHHTSEPLHSVPHDPADRGLGDPQREHQRLATAPFARPTPKAPAGPSSRYGSTRSCSGFISARTRSRSGARSSLHVRFAALIVWLVTRDYAVQAAGGLFALFGFPLFTYAVVQGEWLGLPKQPVRSGAGSC